MGKWNQSLFSCFDDLNIAVAGFCLFFKFLFLNYYVKCIVGFFFCQPCAIGSMLAYRYRENCSFSHFLLGCCSPVVALLRSDARMENQIPGSLLDDSIKTLFCYPCVFCQTVKQYSDRGCVFYPIQL